MLLHRDLLEMRRACLLSRCRMYERQLNSRGVSMFSSDQKIADDETMSWRMDAQRLHAMYQYGLDGKAGSKAMMDLREKIDISQDGRLSLEEFTDAIPALFVKKDLIREANVHDIK
eukprot:gnl/MRDRNA2_/MRDRNA2_44896_c0_seq1.p1 gnl/MRDRNA2_/MRDRNA2_44896_c0~~gnl/MRDRNA2_/MRDRNA2_44896_c0_seq1.p1  ORF type:complete len:116 (+),score=25.47 gnl/MRDRNA2_/MRDRNA2_44896_c0_seq1:105-452(+)